MFHFFLFLFLLYPQINGKLVKRQTDALDQLYLAKFHPGSPIDHSDFTATISNRFDLQSVIPGNEADKINRLPGQPRVGFRQYGGYVTVDETAGKAFYYYFVQAQSNSESKPLLIWLNGGPGCSSLGYGAFQELGPFRVHSNGKSLYSNHFSWNQAANVLFIESPAGVGFSYSNLSAEATINGDKKTAKDNYQFLRNWLLKFPKYKKRELYIAGESYAGHYVPQLAHTILAHNKKANQTLINLKGIMIGNALINDLTDSMGLYEFLSTHSLISDEDAEQLKLYCKYASIEQSDECLKVAGVVSHDLAGIDIYNIYAKVCHNTNLTVKPKKPSSVIDPCSDHYTTAYLNSPDVQKALHANITKMAYPWKPCSVVIKNWTDSPATVIPLLKEFMAVGLRVWIYSGDTDGRIPVTSTRKSIKAMELSVKTPWHPWFLDGEVGGYTQVYHGDLTFATVRGAGHQVPSYEAARSLSLITHFLAGTDLPDSSRV